MDSDEEKRFKGRTSINVLTNTLRTVLMALIGLLLVPYYLDNLGTAAYGIIPLATTMTSYVMILCDSLTYSSSRYSVLALHKGDDEQSNIAVNTAFFGVLRVCILLIPLVITKLSGKSRKIVLFVTIAAGLLYFAMFLRQAEDIYIKILPYSTWLSESGPLVPVY